ncbi:hypothetical protein HYH02_014783 [Chlamydomonas schloesseri]|uniref:AAA+ ATPase domain-containing protein n=1 Tax=Chlamydomonas schloesseri TaxID=2026947 RepID=A0A835SQJ5_9CHLO|nr:hypothetical protein HYH02_014783 [Chlamydomonas schloesseri]|eukprot:KAG2426424.1 hypothetical protein HYH02_014783 [Chlamydomonas schloesseri]
MLKLGCGASQPAAVATPAAAAPEPNPKAAEAAAAAKKAEEAAAKKAAEAAAAAAAKAAADAEAAKAADAAAVEAARAAAAGGDESGPPPVARSSCLLDVINGTDFEVRDKVKEALPSMSFPVSAAAKEVVTLAQQAAQAYANADNLASLKARAVAGLALLHMFGDLLREAPPPPGAAAAAAAAIGAEPPQDDPQGAPQVAAGMGLHYCVSVFRDVVAGMSALARPYTGRGCVLHMLSADGGAERGAFERLVGELTALADDIMAKAKASRGWVSVSPDMLTRCDDALLTLRLGPSYTDHLGKLQGAVKAAGGLEAVCGGAPGDFLDSALVIQELSLGSKISKDLAAALLAAAADKGPARLLLQPELRLLWRTAFGGRAEVTWAEWWGAFPAAVAQLPGLPGRGMGPLADKLGQLLAEPSAKAAFQRHVLAANNVIPVATGHGAEAAAAAGLSAYALAAAFGAPLTDAAAAGFDDLAGEVAAALTAASVAVEGPYQLPPLPPTHVPRDDVSARVAAELTAAPGGGGGGGGDRCRAAVLVAPPGMGKTTLATEVAWRLVEGGGAGGGVVWVDLAGARTWHDVEARVMVALGLIKDNADGRPRIVSTLRACCSPAKPLLLVVDTVDDALRQPDAAEGLWGLLGDIAGGGGGGGPDGCPGVRLLLCSSASVSLSGGAAIACIEVPPMSPATASKLAAQVCPDLAPAQAARLALATRCLPLATRLAAGLRAEGRLSTRDVEALGRRAAAPRPGGGGAGGSEASPADMTVAIIAGCMTALPTAQQVALLQLSALPPAGAGPDATAAALNLAANPAAAVAGRAALTALTRLGLAGQSTLPGRRTQTVMHSLVRTVAVSALAPALDLTVRPAAEDRVALSLLGSLAGWAKAYGGREGGSSVLAAARAAQPEFAELLALLSRTGPRLSMSGGAAPPPIVSGSAASPEEAAAAAGQRLPLETIVTAAKGFNGDAAELLHGLGALPALEAVCEALSAPAVGLVANRACKVEVANVYRVHALALIAQGKYEEAQAHGNMCITLRTDAAKANPASPAIASANMCLAASFAGMRYYSDAEELLRQSVDICKASLGDKNPHTAWALAALAAALEAQHGAKAAEAEPLYRAALEGRTAAQGPHHPRTIEATLALASGLRTAGRYDEARPLYDAAAAAATRVFGQFHSATATAIAGAAVCADAVAAAAAAGGGAAAARAAVAAAAGTQEAHERADGIMAALRADTGEAAFVKYGRARNLLQQGGAERAAEAEALMRSAVDIAGRALPRDPQGREQPLTLTLWLGHGDALVAAGRAAEAVPVFERALAAKVRVLGTQAHADAAAIARKAAEAALAARRWAAAEPLCRQWLAMAQHGVGMESGEAGDALGAYAACLTGQGRHPSAEPLLRQCLDVRKKAAGEAAQLTAEARMALAECLAAQQDAEAAEAHYREAHSALAGLALAIAQGGAKDEEAEAKQAAASLAAAAAAHGLGAALVALGRAKEAEPVLRDALETRQRQLGKDHKDTAATLSALAACLAGSGRPGEAEALFRGDVDAARRQYGADHPNTAAAMSALAGSLQAQGGDKAKEAEGLFRAARDISLAKLGRDHPNSLTVTANLAACLNGQGRHGEALPLYEEELEMTKAIQGEDHPDVGTALNHLATCLQKLERLSEAEKAAAAAVALYAQALGEGHPNGALAANSLGLILLAQGGGRSQEACEVLEKALATCNAKLGGSHPWTQVSKLNLEAAMRARVDAGLDPRQLEAARKAAEPEPEPVSEPVVHTAITAL